MFDVSKTWCTGALRRRRRLRQCHANSFNLLLAALASVSCLTRDVNASPVNGPMVSMSTAIRFVQEGRSRRPAA